MEEKLNKQFEVKGKNFSIRWDPEEEIMFVKAWGIQDKESAEDFFEKYKNLYYNFPGFSGLPVLTEILDNSKTNPKSRAVYKKLLDDFPRTGYLAVCVKSLLIRTLTKFILSSILNKKGLTIKLFSNREEGVEWLKSKR